MVFSKSRCLLKGGFGLFLVMWGRSLPTKGDSRPKVGRHAGFQFTFIRRGLDFESILFLIFSGQNLSETEELGRPRPELGSAHSK